MQLFTDAFATVPDPRADNTRHDLVEMLFLTFVATLCGCKSFVEVAEFATAKLAFFSKILVLKHGIPSHDRFSTVFRMLDPEALDRAFRKFMAGFGAQLAERGLISIDGKALKGAYEKGRKHAPKMMVSAFAGEVRMTLATLEAKGGNEVAAALEILGLIDLDGKIVTADALHTNREFAGAIIAGGGDYCLALKENQSSLLSDARAEIGRAETPPPAPADSASVDTSAPAPVPQAVAWQPPTTASTEEKGHGRREKRTAVVVAVPKLGAYHEFPGLKAVGRIVATRQIGNVIETQTRYYALSFIPAPEELQRIARTHWQIENGLHWELDVVMGEDRSRSRKDNAAQGIAVIRRLALNVARRDQAKGSLAGKLRRAGWNEAYLLELLSQTR